MLGVSIPLSGTWKAMGMVAVLSSSVGLSFEWKFNLGDRVVDCAHRKIFRRRPEQRTNRQGMTLTSMGE
jgi:hypothetical protein